MTTLCFTSFKTQQYDVTDPWFNRAAVFGLNCKENEIFFGTTGN